LGGCGIGGGFEQRFGRKFVGARRRGLPHAEVQVDALLHFGDGEPLRQFPFGGDGDAAGLLGNDQGKAIRLLRDADGSAMAVPNSDRKMGLW